MKTVLVTYASQHGSTAQIAQRIAKVMRQFELNVSAKRMESLDSIAGYDAYVVGTAIYLGNWMDETKLFLEEYRDTLAQKPLWIFCSGPTGEGEAHTLLNSHPVPPALEKTVFSLHPIEIRVFHGRIDLRRLPPNQREIVKAANMPRGDYRDWAAIQKWAMEISQSLSVHAISLIPMKIES